MCLFIQEKEKEKEKAERKDTEYCVLFSFPFLSPFKAKWLVGLLVLKLACVGEELSTYYIALFLSLFSFFFLLLFFPPRKFDSNLHFW